MQSDAKEAFFMAMSGVVAVLAFMWSSAYLWHLGPTLGADSPWWALPYYLTTVFAGAFVGVAVFFGAAVLYGLLNGRDPNAQPGTSSGK